MVALELQRTTMSRIMLGLALVLLSIVVVLVLAPKHVQAGGSGNYPPPATGDWVISSNTVVFNENYKIKGNIIIQSGKSLDLDRVTLSMNSSVAGQFRIEVLSNGTLDMQKSRISAWNASNPYYIVVRKDAHLTVINSTLENMGWKEASYREQYGLAVYSSSVTITGSIIRNSRVGLYVDNATPILSGNNFTGNYRGAWFYRSAPVIVSGETFHNNEMGLFSEQSTLFIIGCTFIDNGNKAIGVSFSSVWIEGTLVEGTYDMGLWAWESNVTMANSSLEARTYDLVLDENSSMSCLNTSMQTEDIRIEDHKSHLVVYYAIDVLVTWWSDGTPVENATVNVTGPDGLEVANGTTDSGGMLVALPVPGYDADYRGFVFHNPFNFTTEAKGLKGNASSVLLSSGQVNITIDDILPSMNITGPTKDNYYNKRLVELTGVLWDNESGPARVEVSYDGKNFTNASGIDIWNLTISLSEGLHNITVRGWDVAGNNRTIRINLTIDTVAPKVAIKAPKNGLITNKTRAWFNGTAEKGANLTIKGKAVNNTNGNWGLFLDLVEGRNNITIEARDRAGNVGKAYVNVTRDTMVDPLRVFPANGTAVNNANFTLNGTTEIGAYVRITWDVVNGTGNNTTIIKKSLNVTVGPTGAFKFSIKLLEGVNNITLYARDVLNNTKSVNLTYRLDSVPPMLVITSPKGSPYYTNKNGVNIKGRTEDGARVFLGTSELQLYDLQFTIRVEVYLGMNNFTISAMDKAGNTIKINLTIVVDKTPPLLNISRPQKTPTYTHDTYYTVTGFTEPNATLYINGISYYVDGSGRFSAKRSLAFGGNTLVITAKDQAGNQKSVEKVVIRERPPPDKMMGYVGYLVPVIVIALAACIILFYMYRTGRLARMQEWLRKHKGSKKKQRMADGDGEDVPPPEGDEPAQPQEAPVAIPGTSGGPSYDDDSEPAPSKDEAEEDIPEMEEIEEEKKEDTQ